MRLKNKRTSCDQSVCPKCGGKSIKSLSYSDTVDFRNLELDVDGLLQQWCDSCRSGWETSEQSEKNHLKIKEAYAAARDRLRLRDGLLTGEQIQIIRKSLSLTQKEAALLFGGGVNSFNKYESGEVLQSYAMDRLIRLVGFFGDIAVEKLRNSEPNELAFPQMRAKVIDNLNNLNVESQKYSIFINYTNSSACANSFFDFVNTQMGFESFESELHNLVFASSNPQSADNNLDSFPNDQRHSEDAYLSMARDYIERIQRQAAEPLNSLKVRPAS